MNLPDMPAQASSHEFLRIAGGFGAPAAGVSPPGGLDIDNAGNVATDGDLTVAGAFDLHGPLQNTGGELTLESALALGTGGVNKLWSAWLLPETAQKSPSSGPGGPNTLWNGNYNGGSTTLDFDQTTREFVLWRVPLPGDYDGSPLAATLYWTADAGTAGQQVIWRVHFGCVNSGDSISVALPALDPLAGVFQGAGLVHTVGQSGTPGNAAAGGLLMVNLNRQANDVNDTLAADARLLAIHVGYA